jgi:hypothetical protein
MSNTRDTDPVELASDTVRFADVQTCSQLAAYLPFMPMPDAWRGHRVEVRLIRDRAPDKRLRALMEPRITPAANPELLDRTFADDDLPF